MYTLQWSTTPYPYLMIYILIFSPIIIIFYRFLPNKEVYIFYSWINTHFYYLATVKIITTILITKRYPPCLATPIP